MDIKRPTRTKVRKRIRTAIFLFIALIGVGAITLGLAKLKPAAPTLDRSTAVNEPTGNLDSSNGEAVMELLRELHRGGSTICMVTHDPRYAQHADRIVQLFDELIVEEETGAQRLAGERELKESGFGEVSLSA